MSVYLGLRALRTGGSVPGQTRHRPPCPEPQRMESDPTVLYHLGHQTMTSPGPAGISNKTGFILESDTRGQIVSHTAVLVQLS